MPLDIRKLEIEEITAFVEQKGEKTFRARQIYEWLWKRNAGNFEQMLNLPLALREHLKKEYTVEI